MDDLTQLDAALAEAIDDAATLIVISGQGGIGKSSLAIRWLQKVGDRYPDGHFYADLRGYTAGEPAGPSQVLAQFLRALGFENVPTDLGERAALWRSATADLRIVMLLDDALSAAQVRALLPGSRHALVVTTARRRLSGLAVDGAVFHQVRALDISGGVDLLARAIGRQRVTAELDAARNLVGLCAGLPLALILVTARLATRPHRLLQSLTDLLADEGSRLTVLELDGEACVRNALDASYAELSPEAARLYRALGWLPLQTFSGLACAAACDFTLQQAEELLDELVESNLVEELDQELFRFHDLVRDHASELATTHDSPPERLRVLRTVCDAFLAVTSAAQRRLTPAQAVLSQDYEYEYELPTVTEFNDDASALTWLEVQHLNLMALVRVAAHEGLATSTWQLVDAMWPFFQRFRQYDLWVEAHRQGLNAAEFVKDATAVRQMLNSGAIGLTAAGRWDEAIDWYERAFQAAQAAGDVRDEGQALHGIGSCHRLGGRPVTATTFLHRAIELWQRCGYRRGVALSRIVLGEIALDAGEADAAVSLLTSAHDALSEVDPGYEEARAVALLGGAHVRAGAVEEGLNELHSAVPRFADFGAALWEARTLVMLGDGLAVIGDQRGATAHWKRAVALYTQVDLREAEQLRRRLAAERTGYPNAATEVDRVVDAGPGPAAEPTYDSGVGLHSPAAPTTTTRSQEGEGPVTPLH